MMATGCSHEEADKALNETDNNCKVAIVMILFHKTKDEAISSLQEAKGFIRNVK